jgi:hypothetical protein
VLRQAAVTTARTVSICLAGKSTLSTPRRPQPPFTSQAPGRCEQILLLVKLIYDRAIFIRITERREIFPYRNQDDACIRLDGGR